MAQTRSNWLVLQELLDQGDPTFVTELRQFHDPERLKTFAAGWHADSRLQARRLLLAYLDEPMNAYRHEPLIKRLFKLAEAANDDEAMARFLVMFDRSLSRRRRTIFRHMSENNVTEAVAEVKMAEWRAAGASSVDKWGRGSFFSVVGRFEGEQLCTVSDSEMPKNLPGKFTERMTRGKFLFSVDTRRYLRRRAWRYFRKLGKENIKRYQRAVLPALLRYTDEDVVDGMGLLDKWGLMHVLFHHSEVVEAKRSGWVPKQGASFNNLKPAPAFPSAWDDPILLMKIIQEAQCRPVRQWAAKLLRAMPAEAWNRISLESWLQLLQSPDADISTLAGEVLENSPSLAEISVIRWIDLLQTSSPEVLDTISSLVELYVKPDSLTLAEVCQLAIQHPVPVVKLAMSWLAAKAPGSQEECRLLLGLAESNCSSLRLPLLKMVQDKLLGSSFFEPLWLLSFFDSRHIEVREQAWLWYEAEPRAQHDVELWKRLLESPYDDVKLKLIALLQQHSQQPSLLQQRTELHPQQLRFLWASVLLNTQRGNRTKPFVVRQLVERILHHPEDCQLLLPLLAVAMRSVRGPEWRAGLAGLVELVDKQESLRPLIAQNFPEIQLQLSTT